jgi:hypothetical protein
MSKTLVDQESKIILFYVEINLKEQVDWKV